jgi:hypothetical protein
MTTSTAAATVRHALLAAAMRGDRPRREAAGMAMPAPQAGQPETGRRRWGGAGAGVGEARWAGVGAAFPTLHDLSKFAPRVAAPISRRWL